MTEPSSEPLTDHMTDHVTDHMTILPVQVPVLHRDALQLFKQASITELQERLRCILRNTI